MAQPVVLCNEARGVCPVAVLQGSSSCCPCSSSWLRLDGYQRGWGHLKAGMAGISPLLGHSRCPFHSRCSFHSRCPFHTSVLPASLTCFASLAGLCIVEPHDAMLDHGQAALIMVCCRLRSVLGLVQPGKPHITWMGLVQPGKPGSAGASIPG